MISRRGGKLGLLKFFIFSLLSSITDLAEKLQNAKIEIKGIHFTFYFPILLSSLAPELKKELSEGIHSFLNAELPVGVYFQICFFSALCIC